MRRSPRGPLPAVLGGIVLLPLALAPAAGGTAPTGTCDVAEPATARVEVHADLAGDGGVTAVRRDAVVTTADGGSCTGAADLEPDALPVAVGVLHSSPTEGSLEVEQLGQVRGPVTTRVAVRDRTEAPRTVTVDRPDGEQEVERRIGVPHLVRTTVTYPADWSRVTPAASGVRTDAVDGGVRVGRSALLFPPVTGDEIVFEVTADAGRGVPTVTVEATPVTDDEADNLAADELERDAAAVVGALTQTGADGAEQLAGGTAELADGLDDLAGGAGQLAAGLDEAAGRGGQLRRGADQVAAGTAELAAGTGELATGLRPLGDGARQVAAGNRQLGTELDRAADGADELAAGNEQLAAGADQLAEGTRQLTAGVTALREVVGRLPDLGPVTDALVDPVGELLAGATGATAGAQELADGSRQLARGNRELADGLREAADGSRGLADGAAQVADGADRAAAGSRELAGGARELADGAAQLSGGVDAYTHGVGEAAGASDQLAAGADEAAAGADELAGGAAQLPEALHQATDTADRHNARTAEERAVVAAGRDLAEQAVRRATGGAATGSLTTELVATGSDPPAPATLAAAVLVLVAAVATGAVWRRRRPGGQP